MPGRRGYRRGGTRSRTRSLWAASDIAPTTVAAGAVSVVEIFTALSDEIKGHSTLARIIGKWGARTTTPDANAEVLYGLWVINEDALAGLVIPDLEQDMPNWMFRDSMFLYNGDVSANTNQIQTQAVDTKAQRKFRSVEQR